MIRILYSIVFTSTLFSCCLISSAPCNCTPPEAFINQVAIDWLNPYSSGTYLIENVDTENKIHIQTISRDYKESQECIGGDECCSNFTVHLASFSLFNGLSGGENLIRVKALQDYVLFSVVGTEFDSELLLGRYDVKTKTLVSTLSGVNLEISDIIIAGNVKSQLISIFVESQPTIPFKELSFVRDIGVTSFIDTEDIVWVKN